VARRQRCAHGQSRLHRHAVRHAKHPAHAVTDINGRGNTP
jgi:hypothetical protein